MGLLPRSRHPRITHWKVTQRRTKSGEAEGHRVKSIWYMSTEKTNLLTVDSNKSHLNRLPARYIANSTQCHSIHAPLVLSLTVIASKLAPSSILGFLFPPIVTQVISSFAGAAVGSGLINSSSPSTLNSLYLSLTWLFSSFFSAPSAVQTLSAYEPR